MNLTPKNWTWGAAHPGNGWLAACAADIPVVWLAWLTEDPTMQADLASLLSADDRSRLERLRLREDQQRFLVGRGLLRILVGAHLNVPAERVELNYGPFGKPFVSARAGAPALQFNVSHSGKFVLLAFHPVREVGVDVEAVRRDLDWEAIACRVFPAQEYRRLTLLDPVERLTAFFQAWTRHEAALKALGLGFADEKNAVADDRLVCFDLALPQGYQGAVASL